jgi:polysaccharide pyruvyl transferase WcaK-like protein
MPSLNQKPMKKTLCVLGSNSGQNLGDVAILYSLIRNILRLKPETVFHVPAHSNHYILRKFTSDSVHWVPLKRHTLSLIRFGVFHSILKSDIVLITDGIIFDVKLFNPNFNWLLSLIVVIPFARLFKRRVVGLLVEIGPLYSPFGRFLARIVCNLCDELLVREPASVATLANIGVHRPAVSVYADAAFVVESVPPARAKEVLAGVGFTNEQAIVGFNVNTYFDRWLSPAERILDHARFTREIAAAMDLVIEKRGARVVIVITQSNDRVMADALLAKSRHAEEISLIDCSHYTPEELQLIIGQLRVLAGMRLHSLIFACAMNTPCIGLVYSPRVRNLMALMENESCQLELHEVERESLLTKIDYCLDNEDQIRARLRLRAQMMKGKALNGFEAFSSRHLA